MKPHCSSCGNENYKWDDGYTDCCNEPVCSGEHKHRYGFPDNFVTACCWAKAEIKFELAGKRVFSGMYRLDDDE